MRLWRSLGIVRIKTQLNIDGIEMQQLPLGTNESDIDWSTPGQAGVATSSDPRPRAATT